MNIGTNNVELIGRIILHYLAKNDSYCRICGAIWGSFAASVQENDYFALIPLLRSFKHETTRRFNFVWKLTIF